MDFKKKQFKPLKSSYQKEINDALLVYRESFIEEGSPIKSEYEKPCSNGLFTKFDSNSHGATFDKFNKKLKQLSFSRNSHSQSMDSNVFKNLRSDLKKQFELKNKNTFSGNYINTFSNELYSKPSCLLINDQYDIQRAMASLPHNNKKEYKTNQISKDKNILNIEKERLYDEELLIRDIRNKLRTKRLEKVKKQKKVSWKLDYT